jgi:hypothetical protein
MDARPASRRTARYRRMAPTSRISSGPLQLAPAVLVGQCRIGLEAARQRPRAVAGLVLACSRGSGPNLCRSLALKVPCKGAVRRYRLFARKPLVRTLGKRPAPGVLSLQRQIATCSEIVSTSPSSVPRCAPYFRAWSVPLGDCQPVRRLLTDEPAAVPKCGAAGDDASGGWQRPLRKAGVQNRAPGRHRAP